MARPGTKQNKQTVKLGKMKGDNMNKELYKIPYIVHEHQMWKAYKREKHLKIALILSNALWLAGAITAIIVR